MCDASKSSVENNLRIPCYSDTEQFTYKHAGDVTAMSSYSYSFNAVKIPKLVKFDRVIMCNNILGSNKGALHCQ